MRMYENGGKGRTPELDSKWSIMGHHTVRMSFICNRTFGVTRLVQELAMKP